MVSIKVNATSANLCVGFDVLGLALDISNTFTFEKSKEFSFEGFEKEYLTINNNMVYDSYIEVFKRLNKEIIPVKITFKGDIPVSRGLGSSSSLIVAGVFGANKILNNPLTKEELFDICANLEGHPDNVGPAIYGNLVASYKKDDKFIPNIYNVSDKLKFMVVIPNYKIKTREARGVLPKELGYSDIVNNLSRIVNLPKAFNDGNVELIKDLFIDKLHEPYRKKLIKEYETIRKLCDKKDVAFSISGSGSTMLIISYNYDLYDEIKKLNLDIRKVKIGSGVLISEE